MKKILFFVAALLLSVINTTTLHAQVLTESFESWDGTSSGYLPNGWTEKHTNQSWHVINPNSSTTLPNAYDGQYYVAIGYDKENKSQDEWLFSPVYELGFFGAMVEYHPAYSPLFLYRVDGNYVNWNTYEFTDGVRVNAADLQTWVRTIANDGTPGKWKRVRGLCEQWMKQDLSTLYSDFFSTTFHSESPIDLTAEEYQEANIQIGFRYVGSHGNIIGIDKFSVNGATLSDVVPTNYDTPTDDGNDDGDDDGDDDDDDDDDDSTFVCTEKRLTYHTPDAQTGLAVDAAYGIIEAKSLYDHSVLATYKGNRITKMNGRIGPECDSVKVMIRPSLYGEPLWERDITEQYKEKYNSGVRYADFTVDVDSIEITGDADEELWVCYKMYFSDNYDDPDDAPDMYYITSPTYMPLGLVVEYDDNPSELYDYSSEGPLYCVMETEGEGGLIPRDLSVDYMRFCRMPVDELKSFNMEVTNHGSDEINTAKFAFEVGNDTYESNITIQPALKYMETRVLEGLLSLTNEGRQDLTIKVKNVNGKTDLYADNNEYKGEVLGLTNAYPRRLLAELSTGDWCGFCPSGKMGLQLLHQNFPDNIISTEIHTNDDYADEFFWFIPIYYSNTYPSLVLNRFDVLDPLYGTASSNDPAASVGQVIDDVKFFVDHKSEGQIHITALELTGDKLKVTTESTFSLDIDDAQYALGFVLCEDSVKGLQTNYYSSESGVYSSAEDMPEILRPYWDKPKYYDTYFDVARLCVGGSGIQDGELPQTIKKDTPYTYTYEIDVPTTVADRNHLSVIAALFDVNETNEVIDCERKSINSDTSAINDLQQNTPSSPMIQRYNISGQRVGDSYKGVVLSKGKKTIQR